jgi:hypothetical protein
MSSLPPSQDPRDEADALYRQASALDSSRPNEAVRRAVLEHAAQLATQRAARNSSRRGAAPLLVRPRALSRPALFGTLAAGVLAGLLAFWRPLLHRAPTEAGAPVLEAELKAPPPAAPVSPFPQAPSNSPTPPSSESFARSNVAGASQTPPHVQTSIAASGQEPRQESAQESARESAQASAGESARESAARELAQASAARLLAENRSNAADSSGADSSAADSSAADSSAVSGAPAAARSPAPPLVAKAARPAVAPDPADVLRHAAAAGDLAAVERLLGTQVNIDARDAAGRTALMLATLQGQTDAVLALLAHGADPNAADASGTTPLQAATAGGQTAIVTALRRYGARP